jgi:hypothetical protein
MYIKANIFYTLELIKENLLLREENEKAYLKRKEKLEKEFN